MLHGYILPQLGAFAHRCHLSVSKGADHRALFGINVHAVMESFFPLDGMRTVAETGCDFSRNRVGIGKTQYTLGQKDILRQIICRIEDVFLPGRICGKRRRIRFLHIVLFAEYRCIGILQCIGQPTLAGHRPAYRGKGFHKIGILAHQRQQLITA